MFSCMLYVCLSVRHLVHAFACLYVNYLSSLAHACSIYYHVPHVVEINVGKKFPSALSLCGSQQHSQGTIFSYNPRNCYKISMGLALSQYIYMYIMAYGSTPYVGIRGGWKLVISDARSRN